MTKQPETENRPVLKAIAAIMSDVGAVEKKGRNEFHRYDYATAADVAHALQKRMAEQGLVIVPSQKSMQLLGDDSLLAIEFEFMVEHVSGDKLEERPVFTGMASAKNSKGGFDDKAANKCLTAATKYFALNLFRIPTGDYHDADAGEEQGKPPSTKPAKQDASPFDDPTDTERRMADGLIKQINACNSMQELKELKEGDDFAATFKSLPAGLRNAVGDEGKRQAAALQQVDNLAAA